MDSFLGLKRTRKVSKFFETEVTVSGDEDEHMENPDCDREEDGDI